LNGRNVDPCRFINGVILIFRLFITIKTSDVSFCFKDDWAKDVNGQNFVGNQGFTDL